MDESSPKLKIRTQTQTGQTKLLRQHTSKTIEWVRVGTLNVSNDN